MEGKYDPSNKDCPCGERVWEWVEVMLITECVATAKNTEPINHLQRSEPERDFKKYSKLKRKYKSLREVKPISASHLT